MSAPGLIKNCSAIIISIFALFPKVACETQTSRLQLKQPSPVIKERGRSTYAHLVASETSNRNDHRAVKFDPVEVAGPSGHTGMARRDQ